MSIGKILITGANGYLAQFIIDRLRDKYELTLTDIVELDRSIAGAAFIKADVTRCRRNRGGVCRSRCCRSSCRFGAGTL